MNLVDANVLLYAVNRSDPKHERSREWLDAALSGQEPVGFSWPVLLAFVRIVTRPGLFPQPLTVDEALSRVAAWVRQPPSVIVAPTSRHLEVVTSLLREVGTGANLVSDADLAALALEHHGQVVTFDHDFGRFTGVRWGPPPPAPGA